MAYKNLCTYQDEKEAEMKGVQEERDKALHEVEAARKEL